MIFRKGKRDSILVSYALLKGFLVVLLLFNPQIFLQCWYGGTHHDSLLAPDVFKCKREKEAEIIIRSSASFESEKRDKKWCSKLLDFHFYTYVYSQITTLQKLIYCLPFTYTKSVWSEESCITNSAYTLYHFHFNQHSQPWLRIFTGCLSRKYAICLATPCILFIPPNFTPKNCAKKKNQDRTM